MPIPNMTRTTQLKPPRRVSATPGPASGAASRKILPSITLLPICRPALCRIMTATI